MYYFSIIFTGSGFRITYETNHVIYKKSPGTCFLYCNKLFHYYILKQIAIENQVTEPYTRISINATFQKQSRKPGEHG